MERMETLSGAQPCYYVLQEEITPKPLLPRRVSRSRAGKESKRANKRLQN